MQSNGVIARQQKVSSAMHQLESNGTILPTKIVEWALLDIANALHGIHLELAKSNTTHWGKTGK